MKFPLNYTDLCLKEVFEISTASRCEQRELLVAFAVMQNGTEKCTSQSNLQAADSFLHPSPHTVIQLA